MSNSVPVSEEDLKQAFKQFVQNPMHRFIINVRRKRAYQLTKLLSGSRILDTTTFEREVWHLESQTYWHGYEIELQLFDKRNGQSRLSQILDNTDITLQELENALATGTLELHGNYIWGQGTNRYAPKQQDEDEKVAQIRVVIDILNNGALPPIEKARRIDAVPGFGENNATGLVMVFHSKEFALVNAVTRQVLEQFAFAHPASTSLEHLQDTLHMLKERLGAEDFIELDWFLYQYSSYIQVAVTNQEKQTWLSYIVRILKNTNEPLSYTEIANRAIALGLQTKGKTPAQTVNAFLTTNPHLFERVDKGKYRLILAPSSTEVQKHNVEDTVPIEQEQADLPEYSEPPFEEIFTSLKKLNMHLDQRLVRRYHLSLKTGGIVILAGPSGTGKTWLAEAYAQAMGAAHLLVPVAPNWTTNEDLLGYVDPLDQQIYHDTPFSSFLRQAAQEYELADTQRRTPRPYHVILDEMNLARVEYYFAKFLSTMEVRARNGTAYIELGPQLTVSLYSNLAFIGTINVDETTHGFADKVYDRAELIELSISSAPLQEYIGETPYQDMLMQIWNDMHEAAPFAFRTIKDIKTYISNAEKMGVSWQEALDEQILHKILPRCKGHGEKIGVALQRLEQTISVDMFPLSNAKVGKMLEGYRLHGIISYF